ncbi:hypothetical protein ACFVG7_18545, partial [Streptomyces sp. NPDC127112]
APAPVVAPVAEAPAPVVAEEAQVVKPRRTRTRKAAAVAEAPEAEAPAAAAQVVEAAAPVRPRRVPTRKAAPTPIPDVVLPEDAVAPRRPRARKVVAPAAEPQFQIAPPSEPVRTTRRFR